jgi:eukaryotic-like serine/threonine-protein kinase
MLRLGKFELHEILGRGGYGTVYRASDTLLQVERAVKVLLPALTADPEFIGRFRREAQIAASLDHPNLVPVYEMGQDGGSYYLAMKYMPGGSLSARLAQQGPLPYAQALGMLRQLAAGLDYAHGQGLVHRDIKPGNILLEADGRPRLADFGFARALSTDSSTSLSVSGALIGTPPYMAPEIWRAQGATPASDQYSLACVFYEMLTGQVLFRGDSPAAIMTRHMIDGPQFTAQWPASTPPGVEAVLRKALSTEPKERFASAGEFVNALVPASLVKPRRLSTVPIGVLAGGVLLAGCLVVVGAYLLYRLINPGPAVVVRVPAATGTSAPTVTRTSRVASATATFSSTETAPPTLTFTPDPSLPPANSQPGQIWQRPKDGMKMVYIPAGEFRMGSTSADANAKSDEMPQHLVSMDGFWIDRTEVTNAMFALCMRAGVCQAPARSSSASRETYYGDPKYADYPVIYVDWQQAQAYCQWVGGDLPSEAQWEKAARGEDERIYPWGNSVDGRRLNFCDANCPYDWADQSINDGFRDTAPAGSYPAGASSYGVLDMLGNVGEWVLDWYSPSYYQISPGSNPSGPASGEVRVERGGTWASTARDARAAYRGKLDPATRLSSLGFRCVH